MTISEFIRLVSDHPNGIIIYMLIVPAVSFILSMFLDKSGNESPAKYLFSTLVYVTCIPGVLALFLVAYDLLLLRADLKNVNMLVYFLPLISMAITIAIINKVVNMSDLPGFKRLSGLILTIAITFVLVFILQKMFIGVVFFGTMTGLLILFVVLFVLIKIGWDRLFKG